MLVAALGPLIAIPASVPARWRLHLADTRPPGDRPRARPARPGPVAWLRARYANPDSWRETGYVCLLATVVPALAAAALLSVLLSLAFIAGPFAVLAQRPGDSPVTLGFERDLHDGAQQKLVSLTMQLGLARLDLEPGSPAAAAVGAAHDQARQLMAELRELIRGIQPQVLTDLGLPAAIEELADASAIPVTAVARLDGRLPPQVENTAYFVVAEALSNVAKHGGATAATVSARVLGNTLIVEIADDGRGGADPERGSGLAGLAGLADRVAVAGGRMLLSSPPGGPTALRVEVPCPKSPGQQTSVIPGHPSG
jgi:Histidine kinase/Putative sensor